MNDRFSDFPTDTGQREPGAPGDPANWLRDTLKGTFESIKRAVKATTGPTSTGPLPRPSEPLEPPRPLQASRPGTPVKLTPEEASAQRLNAIVAHLKQDGEPTQLSDRAILYQIVAQERAYQQERYLRADEELKQARARKLGPREISKLKATMAEAQLRYSQLYGLLKRVTGKLDAGPDGDDISAPVRTGRTFATRIEDIQIQEVDQAWDHGDTPSRQTTYWKLGSPRVLDARGTMFGPSRRGDYIEILTSRHDLTLQVRLQPLPTSGNEVNLTLFALRMGAAIVIGDATNGRITVNGKELVLKERGVASLPGNAGNVSVSGDEWTIRSEAGDVFVITMPGDRRKGWSIRGDFPSRRQGELRGAAILDASSEAQPGYWIGRDGGVPSRLKAAPEVIAACLESWKVLPAESLLTSLHL